MREKDNTKGSSKKKKGFSRRNFLIGSGIVLGATVSGLYLFKAPIRRSIATYLGGIEFPSGISDFSPILWFEVQEDNSIVLKSPKVEMGQGSFTGFAMMVAEELDVALEQIKVVPGASNNSAVATATGGSASTSSLFVDIRKVAATMREMLKIAASNILDVSLEQLSTKDGQISGGGKSISYAEVVAQTSDWKIPEAPELRPRSSFKYVGKDFPRIDLKLKVMGEPIFAIDSVMPDMLYAVTLESPFFSGTLKSLDISAAEQQNGVIKVIHQDGLIAVVAKNRYAAEMGKRQLKAEWDVPKVWQQADIEELIKVGNGSAVNIQEEGNAKKILEEAGEEVIMAEYRTPIGVHAQLEPDGGTAFVQENEALVIGGTQGLGKLIDMVSDATGLSKDKIEARNSYLGGGFGGRIYKQRAADAARISQIMGKPVHVFNDRETEFLNGYYRPSNHHVMRAVVKEGQIIAIEHLQASASMYFNNNLPKIAHSLIGGDYASTNAGAPIFYPIPNRTCSIYDIEVPFHSGVWRGVGPWMNGFPIESFLDEVANLIQKDPIKLRLEILNQEEEPYTRSKKVIETARDKSGWSNEKPKDVGRGFAFFHDRYTFVAGVAEVKLVNGKIRVTKFTHVIDCGIVINPEGVRTQVEGCIMMGLSAALYEEQTVKDGQFAATNYHQYPMAMLWDTPEIEVVLLEGRDKPSGVGEPPITIIAPAIANAVFNLTGQRLRNLPLKLS